MTQMPVLTKIKRTQTPMENTGAGKDIYRREEDNYRTETRNHTPKPRIKDDPPETRKDDRGNTSPKFESDKYTQIEKAPSITFIGHKLLSYL